MLKQIFSIINLVLRSAIIFPHYKIYGIAFDYYLAFDEPAPTDVFTFLFPYFSFSLSLDLRIAFQEVTIL